MRMSLKTLAAAAAVLLLWALLRLPMARDDGTFDMPQLIRFAQQP